MFQKCESITTVRALIRRLARKFASTPRFSKRTARRILYTDLHSHPAEMMIGQNLSPSDWRRRMDCCNRILKDVLPNGILWSSDEAHFHFFDTVNKRSFHYWTPENSQELYGLL